MEHWLEVRDFLDSAFSLKAEEEGGIALIHCRGGINRSATLAMAYLMYKESIPLLEAARSLKEKRFHCCTNDNFQRALTLFAYHEGLVGSSSSSSSHADK